MDEQQHPPFVPPTEQPVKKMRFSTEDYYMLLAAYRSGHQTAAALARACRTTRITAGRAINKGWPDRGWLPLKEALEQEKIAWKDEIRKQAAEEARRQMELRDLSRQEAQDTLTQEYRILALARSDVGAVLALAAEMLPALKELATRVREGLLKRMREEPDYAPSLSEAMLAISRFSTIIRSGVDATNLVVQTERLRRGDPSDTLENKGIPDMTEEEALAELQRVIDTVARREDLGLVVIEGGKGKPGVGKPVLEHPRADGGPSAA